MSDIKKERLSMRNLRSLADKVGADGFHEVYKNVTKVYLEKKEEQKREELKQREKDKKINELVNKIKSESIDIEVLIANLKVHKKKRNDKYSPREPTPPKYRYTDNNGNIKTWTGYGKIPSVLQKAIDKGSTLDSFLI